MARAPRSCSRSTFHRTAAAILTAATIAATTPWARAQPPAPAAPPPALTPLPSATPPPPPEPRVEWNPAWHKFRLWEYFATAGIQAASLYIRWYRRPPDQARWLGNNPVDDSVRGWLVEGTLEDRELAGVVSDRISLIGSAVPFAVDLPVVVLGYHQIGLAWQMLMMNFQAFAVANFLNNTSYYLVGRGRPSTTDCNRDAAYDPICGGTSNNASFPSGHTVTIATATGLTCVHHQRLPIFGNKNADRGICVAMIVATFATGITRIMADRHFATDVLIGATLGMSSGYGLPTLLHYGPRRAAETEPEPSLPTPRGVTFAPFGDGRSVGIGLVGVL